MTKSDKIFVAGHRGMVGSAIVRALLAQGVPKASILVRTRAELDLCDQRSVNDFFNTEKPTQVYLAAAKVGGIHANHSFPAEFIYQNLIVECNVIHAAHNAGVRKLLFLGSSCIYPKLTPQPMTESALLTGALEPTNEPYAIAKIAGIKMCESYNRQYGSTHGTDFRSAMPTNLYGFGDNYHPENSHVIPGLIQRFHHAKVNNAAQVKIWGTGTPLREFLFVDDLAAACLFLMQLSQEAYQASTGTIQNHINIGFGSDITISDLADTIAKVVGFEGTIVFDPSMPDGAPRKLMDSSRIKHLGWCPKIGLADGLLRTYQDFLQFTSSSYDNA